MNTQSVDRDFSAQVQQVVQASIELRYYAGYLSTEEQQEQAQVAGAFQRLRNRLVYDLLNVGASTKAAEARMDSEFSAIQGEGADDWNDSVEVVREDVRERIRSEGRKSPTLRRIVRWTPVALLVLAIAAYFGVRVYNGLTIDQPIQSVAGVQQRAAAAQKVIRYDNWHGGGGGRGGFLMGIVLWPIEPTEAEVGAATEFVSVIIGIHGRLEQEGVVCRPLRLGNSQQVPADTLALIEELAAMARASNVATPQELFATMAGPVQTKYACSQVDPNLLPRTP